MSRKLRQVRQSVLFGNRMRPVFEYLEGHDEKEFPYAKLYAKREDESRTAVHLHIFNGAAARREFLLGLMEIPETVVTVSYQSPTEDKAAHTPLPEEQAGFEQQDGSRYCEDMGDGECSVHGNAYCPTRGS